jgi:hypothetical protein
MTRIDHICAFYSTRATMSTCEVNESPARAPRFLSPIVCCCAEIGGPLETDRQAIKKRSGRCFSNDRPPFSAALSPEFPLAADQVVPATKAGTAPVVSRWRKRLWYTNLENSHAMGRAAKLHKNCAVFANSSRKMVYYERSERRWKRLRRSAATASSSLGVSSSLATCVKRSSSSRWRNG